jgi:serine/threonine protein kinase
MPEAQVLAIGIHIAEGLDAAHRVGLVHRDVKPGNILFSAENVAKIVDFGLAIPADQARNQQGELWATPFYVAPEKLEKRFEDYRSDMYSLGATLFHALTGQPPHPQETASIPELLQAKKAKVDLRKIKRDAHPASVELLNKMLEFSAAKRHQTYNELLVDLRAALAMVTTGVRPIPGMSPSSPTLPSNVAAEIRRSKRFPWFSTIAALGIVGSAAFLFLHPKGKTLVEDTLKRLTKGPQAKGQGTYAGKDPSTPLALEGKFAEAAESLNPILADAKLPAGAKLRFSLKQALLLIFAYDNESAIKALKSVADWTQTAAGAAASPSIVEVRKSIDSAMRRRLPSRFHRMMRRLSCLSLQFITFRKVTSLKPNECSQSLIQVRLRESPLGFRSLLPSTNRSAPIFKSC